MSVDFVGKGMSLTVYTHGDSVYVTASCGRAYADAGIPKKDAPAFALAVLEAAGFTADNSCAGDAIRSLKFQIANEARVAEEAQLDKEAETLLDAGWAGDSKVVVWAEASENFKKHWRAVARKAREMHHVGEETSK